VADRVLNSCTCPGRITHDALWLTRSGAGVESIVRLGLDPATGKLSQRQDTLLSGNFNNFSVTADGGTLVIDDGAPDFSLWTLDLAEALKGKFPDARRRFTTSTLVNAEISPDGSQVLLSRRVPNGDRRLSILPFAGGTETTLNVPGGADRIGWVDAATVRFARQAAGNTRVGLVDVRTGAMSRTFTIPDSLVADADPLPDGWAWIPNTKDRVHIERKGPGVDIPQPAWFGFLERLAVDSARGRVAMMGWNAGTFDSMGVAVAPLAGGTPELWTADAAEGGDVQWLRDGGLLFSVRDTPESVVLYRVAGPGRVTRLGRVARPSANTSLSDDLARISVVERNYHGDAFTSRVVRVAGER
jgi:hypothetical protein